MAHPRISSEQDSTRCDNDTCADPIDPRAFGLAKAAYAVGETLDLLSIGRTSLYAAVKRGDLKCVKFGKKTLFYAADLASFPTRLRRLSEAEAGRVRHASGASKRGRGNDCAGSDCDSAGPVSSPSPDRQQRSFGPYAWRILPAPKNGQKGLRPLTYSLTNSKSYGRNLRFDRV
jgi:hypothetical protein